MSHNCFSEILDLIYKKAPLQKKRLKNYLAGCDASFFNAAEQFSADYIGYIKSQNLSTVDVVDAYLEMCSNFLKTQILFMKTGKYPLDQQDQAFGDVYSDERVMKSYMIGLAISQFLWPTHYQMFTFFKEAIYKNAGTVNSYLEIGPGHGLYLREAMKCLRQDVGVTVVDISRFSIDMTRSIMAYFIGDQASRINYYNCNALDLSLENMHDFITMGEVLEHVNHPDRLLHMVRKILTDEGKMFVSTCVNCPAIDHVYHFKSIDEIKILLEDCGFLIIGEKVLPVENLCIEEVMKKKITINYCAILGRYN